MVCSAFSVLQPLLYAGHAADLCAGGLLTDIGHLFSRADQLDAAALVAVMNVTQTLCEGGVEVRTWLHRLRVPGTLVDVFCVSDVDASSSGGGGDSSSSSIAITCLKALRACIIDHTPSKTVAAASASPLMHQKIAAFSRSQQNYNLLSQHAKL